MGTSERLQGGDLSVVPADIPSQLSSVPIKDDVPCPSVPSQEDIPFLPVPPQDDYPRRAHSFRSSATGQTKAMPGHSKETVQARSNRQGILPIRSHIEPRSVTGRVGRKLHGPACIDTASK